jgi:hypothetical protein
MAQMVTKLNVALERQSIVLYNVLDLNRFAVRNGFDDDIHDAFDLAILLIVDTERLCVPIGAQNRVEHAHVGVVVRVGCADDALLL